MTRRLLLPSWLPGHPLIGQLAAALKVKPMHAFGLVVGCYLGVKAYTKAGIITTCADESLECWARWQGRRGRFAPEFRRLFQKPSGRLKWWDRFNGGNDRPKISDRVRAEVFTRDAGRCRMCGSNHDLQLDHVIPYSRGGPSSADNLQLLCGPCNNRKGARV